MSIYKIILLFNLFIYNILKCSYFKFTRNNRFVCPENTTQTVLHIKYILNIFVNRLFIYIKYTLGSEISLKE